MTERTLEEVYAAADNLVRAYRVTFGSPSGRIVLDDLMGVSGFRSPLRGDRVEIAEGKRQLFLRIIEMLALEPGKIVGLYGGNLEIGGSE